MKFSDFNREDWAELSTYLDTCLLPVTGLDGTEEPWQAREALEALRDALELVEIPFKGRVVTYPAFHYPCQQDGGSHLEQVCMNLKRAGFKYVIVLTASAEADLGECAAADLILRIVAEEDKPISQFEAEVARQVQSLWNPA